MIKTLKTYVNEEGFEFTFEPHSLTAIELIKKNE